MRKLSVDEVKKIRIEILEYVEGFCEENGITCWLACGTLIGAIRHKGFIPWDDDIDIGMLRPDYDRFVSLFNKLCNERYRLLCLEEDPKTHWAFGKVMDLSTVMCAPKEKGIDLSIDIDVFPYDNVPDDRELLKKQFDTRDFLRRKYLNRNYCIKPSKNPIRLCYRFCRLVYYRSINMLFPRRSYIYDMVENCKQNMNLDTLCVGPLAMWGREVYPKTIFESFIPVEFEGKQYKAPVGYDEYLTKIYGNYMEFPPTEERVSRHHFTAYKKENYCQKQNCSKNINKSNK